MFPDREPQRENVKAFNAGKYPDRILLPLMPIGHPDLRHQIAAIEMQGDKQPSDQEYEPERELQKGTALTGNGQFAEAIPQLLAERGVE